MFWISKCNDNLKTNGRSNGQISQILAISYNIKKIGVKGYVAECKVPELETLVAAKSYGLQKLADSFARISQKG